MKSVYAMAISMIGKPEFFFKISSLVTLTDALEESVEEKYYMLYTFANSLKEAQEKFLDGDEIPVEMVYEFLRRINKTGKYTRELVLNPPKHKQHRPSLKQLKRKHSDPCFRGNPSMTFGNLPSWKDFKDAWEDADVGKYYTIGNSHSDNLPDGEYTAPELYNLLKKLTWKWQAQGDEEAGSDVSVVLETLGIEWI